MNLNSIINERIVYYGSLVLLGIGIVLSNLLDALREHNILSISLVLIGAAISISAIIEALKRKPEDFKSKGVWSYLLLIGSTLMILGGILQLLNSF